MDCATCGGHINKVRKSYHFKTRELGVVVIPCVAFYRCDDCGDETLTAREAERVEEYLDARLAEAIGGLPVGGFITLNEAAGILGVTKQALSKHKRINRGFIYSVERGNQKLYYRPSVEAFRDFQDGRVQLEQESASDTVPTTTFINGGAEIGEEGLDSWSETIFSLITNLEVGLDDATLFAVGVSNQSESTVPTVISHTQLDVIEVVH